MNAKGNFRFTLRASPAVCVNGEVCRMEKLVRAGYFPKVSSKI